MLRLHFHIVRSVTNIQLHGVVYQRSVGYGDTGILDLALCPHTDRQQQTGHRQQHKAPEALDRNSICPMVIVHLFLFLYVCTRVRYTQAHTKTGTKVQIFHETHKFFA